MADYQITCTIKRNNSHEGITHLGGPGGRWSVEEVIRTIDAKTNTYYVQDGTNRVEIGVVNATPRYVRTSANGKPTDNLVLLPPCIGLGAAAAAGR